MYGTNHQVYQAILKKLLSHAKNQLSPDQLTLMKPFITQYYARAPLEALSERSIENLFGAIQSHWKLMKQRRQGEYRRNIFNPDLTKNGWETTHTVIQLVLDDQPFLVDSIRNELNRQGLTVHFIVHLGGIKIRRTQAGIISAVLSFDAQDDNAIAEAPIYMEIDRLTDPEIIENLMKTLDQIVHDAQVAVADWQPMVERIHVVLDEMNRTKPPVSEKEQEEVKAFLTWLANNHFTFLGYREYKKVGKDENRALQLVENSGLGVLRDTEHSRTRRYYSELPMSALKLALDKQQPMILAKTNTHSTVHGNRYTDYISIKRYDKHGEIIGEHWFIGLYTSTVYTESLSTIPIVRLKTAAILQQSKLPHQGHAYKTLEHILATLPRDDLFHASLDELQNLSMDILRLQDCHSIRLFARKDIFNRFISCLVYLPQDDFNVDIANRMQEILLHSFHGLEISYSIFFSDSILARLHYTVRLDPKQEHSYDLLAIEKQLISIGRSWTDALHEQLSRHFGEERGNQLIAEYRKAFSSGYQESFAPQQAVLDIQKIEQLDSEHSLNTMIYYPESGAENIIRLKLFHLHHPIPLSDAIPILEKMGFRVLGEQPYKIKFKNRVSAWINDFLMSQLQTKSTQLPLIESILQDTFIRVWSGDAEHDGFNALSLNAGIDWRQISVLRAYSKYLRQIGCTFSQDYMEKALTHNPETAKLLLQLFNLRFDTRILTHQLPDHESLMTATQNAIQQSLDQVVNLDEDRILRMFLNLIHATVRTNYFQQLPDGAFKPYLSFKLNPSLIQDIPLPVPKHEIFVYSPRFEGVHLRAGKVARGGIRWSDRREDFRQEVLGLMKAQQVKNAVIVPAGAKGGFFVKQIHPESPREEIMKEGIHCYQNFIRGLLDLTGNLRGNQIIRPADTVCYDDFDAYLVVAADKGTATFSDIANQISQEYDFWLGDAFASGGSTGYDHKKIGITARGAWESVKWHFHELGRDIQNQPFTVFGIGDMSGDVFGNGMLLSQQIQLIGAVSGAHVFLDPNPDPAISFAERQRLFSLPRSTWEDYNPQLISQGGGVYRRTLKSITLTPEIKNLLGIKQDQMTPNELIQALLKAPVDLLWNGGIGTFVKARSESNADVSDRSNDAIRVNADELTCKVVAEGGNLGFTQLARIEYELQGGRINTDFIDNSGGVDCSDHEVNLKILLDDIVTRSQETHHPVTEKQRNTLLAKMTDQVANLVLHNNDRQVRAISIAVKESFHYLGLYASFLRHHARAGRIDIKLEFLPNDEIIMQRKASGRGLTRPEIAVLSAYSKIILKADIIDSDLPEELYLNHYLKDAFPEMIRDKYFSAMENHRLRREIMATQLSNLLVTDMGITFVYQMADETGATVANIVRAYVIVREIFNVGNDWKNIESLTIPVETQIEMMLAIVRLIRRSVRWLLRNHHEGLDVQTGIQAYASGVTQLSKRLKELLTGEEKTYFTNQRDRWVAAGVPDHIAQKVALSRSLYSILNIVKTATETKNLEGKNEFMQIAKVYFALADRLNLNEFRELIDNYPLDNHWMVLARSSVKSDLDWHQRFLTLSVLNQPHYPSDPMKRLTTWLKHKESDIEHWALIYQDMKASTSFEYSMLVVAMQELLDMARSLPMTHRILRNT